MGHVRKLQMEERMKEGSRASENEYIGTYSQPYIIMSTTNNQRIRQYSVRIQNPWRVRGIFTHSENVSLIESALGIKVCWNESSVWLKPFELMDIVKDKEETERRLGNGYIVLQFWLWQVVKATAKDKNRSLAAIPTPSESCKEALDPENLSFEDFCHAKEIKIRA